MKSFDRLRSIGILIFMLCFPGFATVNAQNCSKINTWIDKAASYTEGIDLNILDVFGVMKHTSPAFHNTHFKPVFGKNFADLTDSDKETIKSNILACGSENPIVGKGLITGFENGNMAYVWNRQVKVINNSSAEENERLAAYVQNTRAINRAKQDRLNEQRKAYAQQRTATRTRSRRGATTTPAPQNPNSYNTSPKNRVNTSAEYQSEASEMKTILTAIKSNRAPPHKFSGYNNANLMQRVYNGNFEGFPIGLKDMQEENLMGGLSKLNSMKKYDRYMLIYLEYFSTHCASKQPSKYKRVKIQYEVIKTENNMSSSEGFTKPDFYFMKSYFENDFKRMHKGLSNAAPIEAIWMLASGNETGLNFEPDLKKLFSENKCESPLIRQFETNLYLAAKGKSSLQKLLPYSK